MQEEDAEEEATEEMAPILENNGTLQEKISKGIKDIFSGIVKEWEGEEEYLESYPGTPKINIADVIPPQKVEESIKEKEVAQEESQALEDASPSEKSDKVVQMPVKKEEEPEEMLQASMEAEETLEEIMQMPMELEEMPEEMARALMEAEEVLEDPTELEEEAQGSVGPEKEPEEMIQVLVESEKESEGPLQDFMEPEKESEETLQAFEEPKIEPEKPLQAPMEPEKEPQEPLQASMEPEKEPQEPLRAPAEMKEESAETLQAPDEKQITEKSEELPKFDTSKLPKLELPDFNLEEVILSAAETQGREVPDAESGPDMFLPEPEEKEEEIEEAPEEEIEMPPVVDKIQPEGEIRPQDEIDRKSVV